MPVFFKVFPNSCMWDVSLTHPAVY